ncbi:MAG: zinc-dependent alcohol dehydrogenase family protein [Rhizomicrobium sp.]
MQAMVLQSPGGKLRWEERPDPIPRKGQVRVKVTACGVCRTDLHVVDGELPGIEYPLIPGHEIVGRTEALGEGVRSLTLGQRVGIPWLGHTCGHCSYCREGRENLCDAALFTGYTRDGGYATKAVADARFVFPLAGDEPDAALAPLLCAGLIGWRSLKRAGEGKRLGLYGFGAAAHIVAQVARFEGRSVFAFTVPGDEETQQFARKLGAVWAGGSDRQPPELLDAAIIFAPVGQLVPKALSAVRKGGRVVTAGIHMSDIPRFAYALLWEERELISVANLTRGDGEEFLALAPRIGVKTRITRYRLADANNALADLREGAFDGAAVLIP